MCVYVCVCMCVRACVHVSVFASDCPIVPFVSSCSLGGWLCWCPEDVWKRVQVKGKVVCIPRVAPKFIKFLRARRSVYREIAAMAALEHHDNVLDLFEVLELVEDSKATLFLVLEMATGGELFDRCVPSARRPG
jgi:hypothetical protein